MAAEIEIDISKDVYLKCYHHLLNPNDDIDIELLWGGRDGGKSKFIAQKCVEDSLGLDYYRALLIKETHNSIKDAQWQMIKDTAEQWQVDHLFKFQSSPLGIKCINLNVFVGRGLDNPAKIRSFTNPSVAWVEEGNQISEDAFVTIITSLRSDYGKVKLYFSFNPESTEPDYHNFWLYKMFFADHEPLLSFTGEKTFKDPKTGGLLKDAKTGDVIKLRYRSTHTTYHDNPFVSGQRMAFHESLATTNKYWYRVFTLGLWGNQKNDSPYAYAFDKNKHVSDPANHVPHPVLNRREVLYLSFDFNRNPMSCLVIQHYAGRVFVLESIRIPKSGVDAICEYIKLWYPNMLYMVTGDYNGNNETSLYAEQITHYSLIMKYLSITDKQLTILPNPLQAKNSTHINQILAYYPVTIHALKAADLVYDLENVKRRADGTIIKQDRDKPEQNADLLDCWRYFCNAFLGDFVPDYEAIMKNQNLTQKLIEVAEHHVGDGPYERALAAIDNKDLIDCTRTEWVGIIRPKLIDLASKLIDTGDAQRAGKIIAEVEGMDKLFMR